MHRQTSPTTARLNLNALNGLISIMFAKRAKLQGLHLADFFGFLLSQLPLRQVKLQNGGIILKEAIIVKRD